MRVITSIFMLLTVTSGVISAYFFGHWLVVRHEHHNWPLLVAAGLIGASIAFGFVFSMLSRRHPMVIDAADPHGGHGAHVHTHGDGTTHAHPHGPAHH